MNDEGRELSDDEYESDLDMPRRNHGSFRSGRPPRRGYAVNRNELSSTAQREYDPQSSPPSTPQQNNRTGTFNSPALSMTSSITFESMRSPPVNTNMLPPPSFNPSSDMLEPPSTPPKRCKMNGCSVSFLDPKTPTPTKQTRSLRLNYDENNSNSVISNHNGDGDTTPRANSNALKRYMEVIQTADDEESCAEMVENREYAHMAGLTYCVGGDVMFVPPGQAPHSPSTFVDWVSQCTPSVASLHSRSKHENQQNCGGSIFTFDDRTVVSAANETHLESEDEEQLRQLAAKITPEWKGEFMAPTLARRLRDFQFAQEKRRKKYGDDKPWGILGLYEHLSSVRVDVSWAEDAAWRRANGLPYVSWSAYEDTKNSGFNTPIFTYLLLIICTAILLLTFGVNGWTIEPLSVNPMIGPSAETLVRLGAKYSDLIVNENDVYRLITPQILHAGLIHYVFNMMALWFVGSAVESIHGFTAAAIIFIISGIGGTLLSAIFLPQYISVGASGGIFGLIGSCLADIIINWHLLFSDFVNEGQKKRNHVLILVFLLCDIIANALLGMTPFVDNFTHLGGMLFGFLCGLSTMERLSYDFFGVEQNCQTKLRQILIRFLGLIVSVTAILAATVVLLEGDGSTTPCPSCSYLSCVPFPPWSPETNKWWYCDDCGSISADAKYNPDTRTFDQIDLKCPDGEITSIVLGDESTSDKAWLENNLPSFCRKHCDRLTSH